MSPTIIHRFVVGSAKKMKKRKNREKKCQLKDSFFSRGLERLKNSFENFKAANQQTSLHFGVHLQEEQALQLGVLRPPPPSPRRPRPNPPTPQPLLS